MHFLIWLWFLLPQSSYAGCPFIFGDQTPRSSTNSSISAFAVTQGVTITGPTWINTGNIQCANPAGNIQMSFYTNNAGQPGNLLTYSNSQAVVNNLNTHYFRVPYYISSTTATIYWYVYQFSSDTPGEKFDVEVGSIRGFIANTPGTLVPDGSTWTMPGGVKDQCWVEGCGSSNLRRTGVGR